MTIRHWKIVRFKKRDIWHLSRNNKPVWNTISHCFLPPFCLALRSYRDIHRFVFFLFGIIESFGACQSTVIQPTVHTVAAHIHTLSQLWPMHSCTRNHHWLVRETEFAWRLLFTVTTSLVWKLSLRRCKCSGCFKLSVGHIIFELITFG